jgi:hypothetical protein
MNGYNCGKAELRGDFGPRTGTWRLFDPHGGGCPSRAAFGLPSTQGTWAVAKTWRR